MEDINFNSQRPAKKHSRIPVIFVTAAVTFLATFLILSFLIISLFSSPATSPFLFSMLASDHNDVLAETREYIDSNYLYEIDEKALNYGAAKGMVEALGDPYTRYLPPAEFTEYINDGAGNYIGVGIIFSLSEDNKITVTGTYPDSPGDKAGIKSGDILIAVDDMQCSSENYDESISYIRGEHLDISQREGAAFNLTYLRKTENGNEITNTVTLTRQSIHVSSVTHKMLDENIGYICVSAFNKDTDSEFVSACDELEKNGMKELIIDLRDNGGGDFNVAINMAGYFLDDNSLVVYTVDKYGKKTEYHSDKRKYHIKPVILVNGHSASASEVFTGALRDHNAHTAIVGTKTFGKGITQNVYTMASGGGLIVTVDTYYTPNGDSIHKKGITPTDIVEIASPYNEYPASYYSEEVDTQKAYAIELLKK